MKLSLGRTFFFSLASASALAMGVAASAAEITGAGSTFVYPLISKWADTYKKETGTSVNYQSIGSGGGIKQIQSKTVDFGATDKPMTPEELAKDGLVQFPVINGGVVPVFNLTGIQAGTLKLTGPVIANIFLGNIKKWNDKAIAALNKGLKLPATDISVVHRSDGSGTSFIWTNYLSKVSPDWKTKVGEGTAVAWPTGMGGKGNEGVASYVQRIQGAIGYVEYAYALQNNMAFSQVKNREGSFVKPSSETFAAAAGGAEWNKAPGYYLILTDAPGKTSWPIAGSVFVLMHKTQDKPEQGKEVIKFFRWAFSNGTTAAKDLNYVPLPTSVQKLIETTWSAEIKGADGTPVAANL